MGGGPKAEELLSADKKVRFDKTMAALGDVFSIPRKRLDKLLETWSLHDWQKDPFSGMAYTYVGVGGLSAVKALARPVQQILFFAGEATDSDEMGTVAGALKSGQRAAEELLDSRG
jgi:monoamine oxidase